MSEVTEPLVCKAGNAYPFRVRQSQRCDGTRSTARETVYGDIYACKNEQAKGLVTVDRNLRVRVRELLFPGDSNTEVVGKWIYVIQSGSFAAEVHAVNELLWEILLKPDISARNDRRSMRQ